MQSAEGIPAAADGGLLQAVKVDFSDDDPDDSSSPPIIASSQTEQRERGNPPPLMEIYSVRFLDNDEFYILPHVHGVIAVEGSSGTSILFNRKVGDPRLVNPEGLVKLSGRGLKVEGDILIKPYLFGTEFIAFNGYPPGKLWRAKSNKCIYDKLLVTEIECGVSNLQVEYAVYREAIEAMVDVTLIDLLGRKPTEFGGTVKAWNTQVGAINCLFEEQSICDPFGKAGSPGTCVIPLSLSRRFVVVPCNSSLVVRADISHHREYGMIAAGTVRFPARSDGEEVQVIHGKGCMIEVKVTWLKNDGSDKVQHGIVGRVSDAIECQWSDGSFRPLKMRRLDDTSTSSLSSFGGGDGADMEMEFEMGLYTSRDYERKLLEVFSVRFVDHPKLDISKIFGTIFVETGCTSYILYNRKLGDPPCIDSEGFVTLTAPRHGIDVCGRIELYHYLFDLKKEVIFGYFMWWRSLCYRELVYDQVMSHQLQTAFGPVEVTAAVYFPGAEATLDVTLLDCEEEGPIEVYGHVKVKNDRVPDPRAVSCLFKKESKAEAIRVSRKIPGGSISLPLLRRAVVVPLGSKMIVDACIKYGNTVFASGEQRFDAMLTHSASKLIIGGRGKIKVDVSWRYLSHVEDFQYCW